MLLGEQGARWAWECLQQDAESQPAPGPTPKAFTAPCAPQGWSPALSMDSASLRVSAIPNLCSSSGPCRGALSPGEGSSHFQHPSQHSLAVGIAESSSYPMDDAAETFWLLQLLPPPANPHPEGVRGPGVYLELSLTSRSSDLAGSYGRRFPRSASPSLPCGDAPSGAEPLPPPARVPATSHQSPGLQRELSPPGMKPDLIQSGSTQRAAAPPAPRQDPAALGELRTAGHVPWDLGVGIHPVLAAAAGPGQQSQTPACVQRAPKFLPLAPFPPEPKTGGLIREVFG